MDNIKDIYIPYLYAGYSEDTVQDLLCDMKIYRAEDHEKIHHTALEILTEQNEDIQIRNINRHWVVKVLDTLLWALSLGFLRLLENEIKIDKLMSTANKIQEYVQNTPLINQMDRKDYVEACEKTRLEDEAKQQEIEQLQQELEEKGKDQQAALAKLAEEFKVQNAARREAEEKARHESAEKQAELKAAAEKAQQEFNAKQAELKGEVLQSQEEAKKIRKEIKQKLMTDEQRQMKALKAEWLDKIPDERHRLKAKGLLPQGKQIEIARLQSEQIPIAGLHSSGAFPEEQFEAIVGRVQEIKKKYSGTHYVFTHGQGRGLWVINECMQRLLGKFTPSLHNPLSVPFRLPHSVDLTENVTEFFKKYPNAVNGSFIDNDVNKATGELLSVDSYMWNIARAESALSFFSSGISINMEKNSNVGESIFRTIFINYLKDDYLCNFIAKKAQQISVDQTFASRLGTLWAICIPKTVVEDPSRNMVYRSHPFGKKCTCHPSDQDIKIIERTQQDEAVPCPGGFFSQYRLLTARLLQEPGVRSFPVNGLTKAENKDFKKRIKNLVREVALYSAIVDLRTIPSPEEAHRLIEELKALSELKQLDRECLEYLLLTKREYLIQDLCDTMELAALSLAPEENFAYG